MAVLDDDSVQTTISNEALNLLECFVEGLDAVIYEIAAKVARERRSAKTDPEQPVQIESQDVKMAAEWTLLELRELVDKHQAPPHLRHLLDSMQDCFENRQHCREC